MSKEKPELKIIFLPEVIEDMDLTQEDIDAITAEITREFEENPNMFDDAEESDVPPVGFEDIYKGRLH